MQFHEKWPKINFWTGKKFKTARNTIPRKKETYLISRVILPGLFYIFWPAVHLHQNQTFFVTYHTLSSEKMRNSRCHSSARGRINKVIGDTSDHFIHHHQWRLGWQQFPESEIDAFLPDSSRQGLGFSWKYISEN